VADKFTYDTPQAPAINAVDPNRGSSLGGTEITLYGSGLSSADSVMFGTQSASFFFSNGDNSLTVAAPSGTAFTTVDITVTTPVGTSSVSGADKFTWTVPVIPEVDGLSPIQGPSTGGISVTIYGAGFSGATTVAFGATTVPACSGYSGLACFYTQDDTHLVLQQSPSGTIGTPVHVTVTNPAGTSPATAADQYNFIAASAPVVYGVSPSQGPTAGGGIMTIYGRGFAGLAPGGVHFGSTATNGSALEDTQIFVTIPAASAGTVDVTVTAPGGTSATGPYDKFTYVTPVAGTPVIHGIRPNVGTAAGETRVTVLGSGFTGATSVSFGGTAAASFSINGDTRLTAISPPGTAGTTVEITIVTPGGTSVHATPDRFTYVTASAPVISSIAPSTGITGAIQFTHISGSGFLNGDCACGVTGVAFGSTPAAYVDQISDNVISVQTPALPAGTVDVTVTTSSGISTATTLTCSSAAPASSAPPPSPSARRP
jgi:hypothetical protein